MVFAKGASSLRSIKAFARNTLLPWSQLKSFQIGCFATSFLWSPPTILHPSSIGIKVIFSENSAPLHRETLLFPASSIHLSSTNLLIFLEPNLKYKYEKTNWTFLKTLPIPTWKLLCEKKVESFQERHTEAQRHRGKRTHRHFSITSFRAQRWRWWGRGARQL